MQIPTDFDSGWYDKPRINHLRDFTLGNRVGQSYDGDVLLFSGQGPMFGVDGKAGHSTSAR